MRERKDTHAPNSLGMRSIRNGTTAKAEVLKAVGHYDNSVPVSVKMFTKPTTFRKIQNFRTKLLREEVESVN